MQSNYPAGTLKVSPPNQTPWTCSPSELLYSTATMCASHYWSTLEGCWIPIDGDVIDMPTFLSVDRFPFRNSEVSPNGWGVLLDGEPIAKWETADSERGYVDLWAREQNQLYVLGTTVKAPIVYRHRLFGNVEFVKL